MDFALPADQRVKLKENEKRDKYQDLVREPEKLWNMKVTVTQNVIGAFRRIHKRLVKGPKDLEIRGQVESIQTTASVRILRRVLKICCQSNSSKKPSANVGMKNSQFAQSAAAVEYTDYFFAQG